MRGGRGPVAMSLQCQLSRLWRNEQDSLMISAVRDNGDFQEKYLTWITLAGSCAHAFPLKGAQQQSNATTAFVGQCFMDTGRKETLTTTWLLHEAIGSLKED
ncbi:avidin-related protein 2-like [Harpia harpyja]|uniref:avidin-related protein 2-like n=1 Tax=Harpia harpyja TaxID=202280 RepID=UPI0022B1538D|nr:avidin-related protein 2-like [Harpia harpyja]